MEETNAPHRAHGTTEWVLITGEYPPQPGGVSDYTRLVAEELAAAGEGVLVFAPPPATNDFGDAGPAGSVDARVRLRRLPDHFGPRGLRLLDQYLDSRRRPVRLLVQYVPHAFGARAMNVRFCAWLARRGRRDEVWTLFHEVAFPVARAQALRHNVLGVVHRLMAGLVVNASRRVFVTIPGWGDVLAPLDSAGRRGEWLPVPANLPATADPAGVAAARRRALGGRRLLLGHFGTFGRYVADLLHRTLPDLLRPDDRAALLIGRGGPELVEAIAGRHPFLRGRLHAPGALPGDEVVNQLAACDLIVQPYPDGVSSRRSSVMGSLALGAAVVTNRGALTERIWAASGAVALAPDPSPAAIVREAERVLADPALRASLGVRAKALYDGRFHIRHTIDALLSAGPTRANDVGPAVESTRDTETLDSTE